MTPMLCRWPGDEPLPLHLHRSARFLHGHVPESINLHTEELTDYEPRLRADAKAYIVVVAARGRTGPAVRRVHRHS